MPIEYEVVPLEGGGFKRRRSGTKKWHIQCGHGRPRKKCKKCTGGSGGDVDTRRVIGNFKASQLLRTEGASQGSFTENKREAFKGHPGFIAEDGLDELAGGAESFIFNALKEREHMMGDEIDDGGGLFPINFEGDEDALNTAKFLEDIGLRPCLPILLSEGITLTVMTDAIRDVHTERWLRANLEELGLEAPYILQMVRLEKCSN